MRMLCIKYGLATRLIRCMPSILSLPVRMENVELRYSMIKINWKSTSFLFAAVTVLAATALLMLTLGDSASVQAQTPDEEAPRFANMGPLLNEIAEQHETGSFTASAAAANAPVSGGESVGVIFLTEAGEADDIRDFLLENGASPGPAFDTFVGADVPVSLLAEASQQDGVNWMHASVPPRVRCRTRKIPRTKTSPNTAWTSGTPRA